MNTAPLTAKGSVPPRPGNAFDLYKEKLVELGKFMVQDTSPAVVKELWKKLSEHEKKQLALEAKEKRDAFDKVGGAEELGSAPTGGSQNVAVCRDACGYTRAGSEGFLPTNGCGAATAAAPPPGLLGPECPSPVWRLPPARGAPGGGATREPGTQYQFSPSETNGCAAPAAIPPPKGPDSKSLPIRSRSSPLRRLPPAPGAPGGGAPGATGAREDVYHTGTLPL
ncbi:unnamed protein product [Caenorhabditis brenneri]